VAFVYFCIYETKGLSLEQVDELYAQVSSAKLHQALCPLSTLWRWGPLGARRSTLADLEQATLCRKSSAAVHEEYIHKD
jgi:hypothetical protein